MNHIKGNTSRFGSALYRYYPLTLENTLAHFLLLLLRLFLFLCLLLLLKIVFFIIIHSFVGNKIDLTWLVWWLILQIFISSYLQKNLKYDVKRVCISHLVLLSVKNTEEGVGRVLLNIQNPWVWQQKLFVDSSTLL